MGSSLGQSVRTLFVPATGSGRPELGLLAGPRAGARPRSATSPAVLQVVTRLEPDEAGRCTLDVARALACAGWRAPVATAGGPLERELALLLGVAATARLPLDAAGPLTGWRNARLLARVARGERGVAAARPGPRGGGG
jgi:hypothetical protein